MTCLCCRACFHVSSCFCLLYYHRGREDLNTAGILQDGDAFVTVGAAPAVPKVTLTSSRASGGPLHAAPVTEAKGTSGMLAPFRTECHLC